MWSKGQGSSLRHSRYGFSFFHQRLYTKTSYWEVAGKNTADRLGRCLIWQSWMWYLSSRKVHNFKYIYFQLAGFCELLSRMPVSDWILQKEYRYLCEVCDITSCKFLCLCVPGVDTILCYYIFQGAIFHPHPDGFYLTCSGFEGSCWGRDAASQTTSAWHNCALSQKKKIQVYKHSLKLSKLRGYTACSVTSPLDYQQRWVKLPLLCLAGD